MHGHILPCSRAPGECDPTQVLSGGSIWIRTLTSSATSRDRSWAGATSQQDRATRAFTIRSTSYSCRHGAALLQVMGDLLMVGGGDLTVEELVEVIEGGPAVQLVRIAAAHDGSPCDPARIRPRSIA